jgi:hypothetical protein
MRAISWSRSSAAGFTATRFVPTPLELSVIEARIA